jgi:hypothetical protein
LEKLTNQLQLANSLAAIERSDVAIAKKKKTDSFAEHLAMAPMVVEKLAEKGGHVIRLTKKDISALLFVYCHLVLGKIQNIVLPLIVCALKFPEVWRGSIHGDAFTRSLLTPCEGIMG